VHVAATENGFTGLEQLLDPSIRVAGESVIVSSRAITSHAGGGSLAEALQTIAHSHVPPVSDVSEVR
jgi:hypothetical protein